MTDAVSQISVPVDVCAYVEGLATKAKVADKPAIHRDNLIVYV